MKSLHTLLIASGLVLTLAADLHAQQEGIITQFMFNRLYYTPAFAGSGGHPTITAIYRKQWIGLEGSPEHQVLSAQMPLFNQRVGLGVNLSRQAIGITRQLTAELAYAYRIPLGRGYLSAGFSGSVRYFAEDYRDSRVKGTQDIGLDQAVPTTMQSRYLPNFGAGVYYQAQEWYAGVGLPRLLEGDIDFGDDTGPVSTERRHIYALGGYRAQLSPYFALHPQVLFRYVDGAPFDADVHLGLELNDQFHAGATYRLGGHIDRGGGESVDLILGFRIRQQLLLSVAYDVSISRIRTYQNGTFEVLLQYAIGRSSASTIDNPRFFD
ncbi:MAG: type IX secretion system membrane protein PorP/SprF [Saprospiraceae bacterium]|nr:type IX secretion system membrane protein PorP/SprF [Saprospiraceae bacterium]